MRSSRTSRFLSAIRAIVRSAHGFLLLRSPNSARSDLGLGSRQKSKARLAPREIDADIEQGVRAPAGAGKLHDRDDAIGLPGLEGHWPSRDMVWSSVDA